MKIGMKESERVRAGSVADEIYHANNLIASRGGQSAEFPPCTYRDMCTGGRSGLSVSEYVCLGRSK